MCLLLECFIMTFFFYLFAGDNGHCYSFLSCRVMWYSSQSRGPNRGNLVLGRNQGWAETKSGWGICIIVFIRYAWLNMPCADTYFSGWSFFLWWVLCVLNHLNGSQSGWLLGVSFCRFEETYRISSTFSSLKILHQHTNSRRQIVQFDDVWSLWKLKWPV